jgi:antirestriction protein ArdC
MNVYEIITNKILEELERGECLPWHKPWKSALGEEPVNMQRKKAYRGLNRFLLGHLPYERPYFVTYDQAKKFGGHVKSGEKGAPVIFWKRGTYTKNYTVFNIAQCDGLERHLTPAPDLPVNVFTPIERAESIAAQYHNAPAIRYKAGDRAYYTPPTDTVVMPERSQFSSAAEFYSTLFHELTHSTGHESRLKRASLTDACYFGDTNYSQEELVAELGAAFLCGEAGIDNAAALKNSAAYVDGWRRKLKGDSRLIVTAAAQAQKAADYILGIKHEG